MNQPAVPECAKVVIIGGGVMGCSLAYHLAKFGWTNVVLLERRRLTSGTTWHAAGLIAQLRATASMTRLARYSQELYAGLGKETGVETGFVRTGSISVALSSERQEELNRSASMARAFGVEVAEVTPNEIKRLYPELNIDGVVSGVYLAKDGQGDPANIALALAKGARQCGATLLENVSVLGIDRDGSRAGSVKWKRGSETGRLQADFVVNCAGMWGRDVGLLAGAAVPLQACEHFYIVTEPIDGLGRRPVLRVPDECTYYKEDAGKLLIGAFEPVAKPWGLDGIPEDFEFDQLPEDYDHFEPILDAAVNRFPLLEEAGIHTFFNGPESFTPDTTYYLGLIPGFENFYVAAGFNSVGIQSAGGAGMALAKWIMEGEQPFDLHDVNIARMQPFQNNRRYLEERSRESLGLLYADHFPFRQKDTARGVRRTPFHHCLMEHGAVMGEIAGWERANWYARPGQERVYRYTWSRPNWFENWRDEHMSVRTNVGMYDMSSFGKIHVQGPDAEKFLNRVCGANMSVPVGKTVYTQFLNSRGGIEADVTVSRLAPDTYLVVTPAATRVADQAWLERHKASDIVAIVDVTAAEGVLAVMGPNSRRLLQSVSPNDFSNAEFPFGTWQTIEIGMGLARAHRISYVGELGWELYISSDMAVHVFEVLLEAGREFDLRLCGMHMMDSCRSEKAFRHFGHDICAADHVLEAGLGFAVSLGKPEFIGRDAVLRKRETGLECMMLQFLLTESEPLLYHKEPILRDGEIVGYLSSGSYGHALGAAVGLGYVPCRGEGAAQLLNSSYQIEVAGTRVDATASARAMYDPKSSRVRT
ncbi:MAG: FAD-dependent oxidoreductase [Rhodobacteraceae bacterium]|nr:FAD-dependent oxidoreductase [Paracoccaceae bacterium]